MVRIYFLLFWPRNYMEINIIMVILYYRHRRNTIANQFLVDIDIYTFITLITRIYGDMGVYGACFIYIEFLL